MSADKEAPHAALSSLRSGAPEQPDRPCHGMARRRSDS